MAYNLIECNREQMYLMPVSLEDWLSEGHLAWFMLDAVEAIDLSQFYLKYRADGWGHAAYDPQMMVSLLLYAYCLGVRSSRQIERACEVDVAFRVIAGNLRPDYSTICRFRSEEEEDRLCGKGSRGDEIPEELRDRRSRLARLKECRERLAMEKEEKAQYQAEKIEKRQAEEASAGHRKRGRKPKETDEILKKAEKAKANETEPDSRIMKTRKGYIQGYNAQAIVDKGQIILADDVTQEPNDVHQLHPMTDKAKQELQAAGVHEEIKSELADAGYWSENNVVKSSPTDPEFLIAPTKELRI